MDDRTQSDFSSEMAERYIPALVRMTAFKGEQYSGGDKPALVNFYEGGKLAKDTPQHYLMSLATKQWGVIATWSKKPSLIDTYHKAVVQRLFDVIVYMFLLLFMIEGEGKVELPGEGKEIEA